MNITQFTNSFDACVGHAKLSGNTETQSYEGYTLSINKYVDDKGNPSHFSVDVVDPSGRHVLSTTKPSYSAAKEAGKKIAETHKLKR